MGGVGGRCTWAAASRPTPPTPRELARHGRAVGERLAARGVLGRASVDFAAAPGPTGTWHLHALEVNLRKGGTTHPYAVLRNLAPGRYDEAGRSLGHRRRHRRAPTGRPTTWSTRRGRACRPAAVIDQRRGRGPAARPDHRASGSCSTCCRASPSTAASASPPSAAPRSTRPSSTRRPRRRSARPRAGKTCSARPEPGRAFAMPGTDQPGEDAFLRGARREALGHEGQEQPRQQQHADAQDHDSEGLLHCDTLPTMPSPASHSGSCGSGRGLASGPVGPMTQEQRGLVDETEPVAVGIEAIERTLSPWSQLDR